MRRFWEPWCWEIGAGFLSALLGGTLVLERHCWERAVLSVAAAERSLGGSDVLLGGPSATPAKLCRGPLGYKPKHSWGRKR